MKHLLLTTIAAVVLVGCGESQESAPPTEVKPAEPVAEAIEPETPKSKKPDISIHDAVEKGNIEAVKQHLAAGTDVNAKDHWTPLLRAAWRDQKEIAELLIVNGADLEAKCPRSGMTPLIGAAMLGHWELVHLLINKGADVYAKEKELDTLLHLRKVLSNEKFVELLITKGVDVNAKNDDGKTPLDKAIEWNFYKIADLLRKHGGKTAEELKAEGK